MKNKQEQRKRSRETMILMFPVLLIAVFIFLGFQVWVQYRDTLMENQADQLLRVSETLKNTIEISIMEYEDDLNFLTLVEQEEELSDQFYETYLESKDSYICNIIWEDAQGGMVRSVRDVNITKSALITRMNGNNSIHQYNDQDDRRYLVFKSVREQGDAICLLIDEEQYYLKLISNIRIGTNGYILLKNSDGQIIMHPDRGQWGIDVIEGRKELHPELDFSSLEEMIKRQKDGETGISEYYSYWWMDTNIPRVKKIAAYIPAAVGSDFWIISAVTDYNDFYIPVMEGFLKIILVFVGIIVILMLLSGGVAKLLSDREKAAAEIIYLKELNALLEEVQRGEEALAHQERLQIMGTITSGIAHEFNNFLTPILGHAELLMMTLPEESEYYDSAQEIYDASKKAADVVRQISTLSRKNVETVYKRIAAEPMLRRALKLVESVCPQQIQLADDILYGDTEILGNATQLNQVILNICVNAIHAIGKNEGKILVQGHKVSKQTVELYTQLNLSDVWKRYIQIDIIDNGKGMDADTLRHIFDPFFTTKKGGEGTGLGLSLVEQIVHSHKGYIGVESEVGTGSAFHIFLPILEAEQEDQDQKEDMQLVIGADNAKVLQLLEKNFAKLKYSVQTSRTMDELQACLEGQRVDVLVIEQHIDGISSIDFAMAMKAKYPDLLFIVMVDAVTREVLEARKRKIINGYIEKPVSVTMILETIRSCMAED